MAHHISHPKQVQAKSRTHTVEHLGGGQFNVTSGESGNTYSVELLDQGAHCTCDWAKYRPAAAGGRSGCSHVIAVYNWLAQGSGGTVSAWADPDAARRQHRATYDIGDGVLLTVRKG